ncbi:hypothetical protein O181_066474 [Austropuccinia psidii MF-1]|uniref:Uncharacterized protein n=1 Tax=Austropuccinia psidii MF-1 TaxID=1389203 RepID=A0A9Q3ETJ0_9BASI|nr:hypothetical protein [Austropuccinia psidii MF-1]
MTPTGSGIYYFIQSNGSGPGHSSHRSEKKEFQPRGEAQIEDSRASTSSQRLDSTFDTLLQCPEAYITAIPVVRSEQFPIGCSGNIPVSVQELVYGRKTARMRALSKPLYKEN